MTWNVSGNWNIADGYVFDPTIDYIEISSGMGTSYDVYREPILLYQYSDNFILCKVLDEKGLVLNPSLFSDAEYRIANRRGQIVATIKLNEGVSVLGSQFLIHIGAEVLDKTHRGSLQHQFTLWSNSGYKLPPVFGGKVKVIPVFEPIAELSA